METVAVRTETSAATTTEVLNTQETSDPAPVLRLRLNKPKNSRKVVFSENTVDNEHLGRKKSKCCCIYKKPHAFGESSSEDDEECDNCFGHPEKRKRNRKDPKNEGGDNGHEPEEIHDQSCPAH